LTAVCKPIAREDVGGEFPANMVNEEIVMDGFILIAMLVVYVVVSYGQS
jgi:hypothetical protein